MKRKNVRIAACALAGMITVTTAGLAADATAVSMTLPVAGVSLILDEGISIDKVKEKTGEVRETPAALVETNTTSIDTKEELMLPRNIADAGNIATTKQLDDAKASGKIDISETETETQTQTETQTAELKPEAETETELETETEVEIETETEMETETEAEDFSGLVIAKVNDYVNVRDIPSEEGEIVGKLFDKSVGTFISETDGWYEINSGNVTGYVKGEYCVTGRAAEELAKEVGSRIATVTTTTLYVRKEPSTDSPVLGMIPLADELSVAEELDGWVKVSIEEGDGYVSTDYVTLRTDFVKAESKAEEEARLKKEEEARNAARAAAREALARNNETNNSKNESKGKTVEPMAISGGSEAGNSVASFATQFVGNPYVYGGTSLTNGADCSGFVMSVYKNFGVSLPRTSSSMRSVGSNVGSLENAQPGDLVCYSGHVALYIGGGQIVHASTAKTGIIISNANYRKVLAVRRVF